MGKLEFISFLGNVFQILMRSQGDPRAIPEPSQGVQGDLRTVQGDPRAVPGRSGRSQDGPRAFRTIQVDLRIFLAAPSSVSNYLFNEVYAAWSIAVCCEHAAERIRPSLKHTSTFFLFHIDISL